MDRWIIHVDMDEFFAAVEKLDHPEYRGKCLLIGGDPKGRGVVSTASYEARAFGCHSAMPMSQALRLCPPAIVLPVRGGRYAHVSRPILAILGRFSPLVEPLSIDEAFLDATGCERLHGRPREMAAAIKKAIKDEVGLTASLGVAPNKFLAKLASDLQKPDGLVVIEPGTIHETLDPLGVRKIWGVGPAAEKVFDRLGIKTIGQLRRTPMDTLKRAFGNMAEHYWNLAHGLDDREIVTEGRAASIGQEQTFATDVADLDELRKELLGQVEEVGRRLRKHGLKARTVTLKIRYGDFTTITRSQTFAGESEATDVTADLWRASREIFDAWAAKSRRPLRLIGMTASNLTTGKGEQLPLFEEPSGRKQKRLDGALDDIVRKFGRDAVRRGRGK